MKKKKTGAELEQEPAEPQGDPITGEVWHNHKTKKKKKPVTANIKAEAMMEWIINQFLKTVPESLMKQTEFEMEHLDAVTASTMARWQRFFRGPPQ